MESAKLSEKELVDAILYGVRKNEIDTNNISNLKTRKIINDYIKYCIYIKKGYVRGELDTFKRAACLLVAINKNKVVKDKRINASIAIDSAYKMCEKPYWNVGDHFDIPKKLEEVNYSEIFQNDMYAYDTYKSMLIDSLMYEKGSPLNYSLSLKLFYQFALQIKHKNDGIDIDEKKKELILI